MFSKRTGRMIVSATIAATLGGGLFLYGYAIPAATNINPPRVDDRPAIANDAPYKALAEDPVDAGGIVESWRDGGYTYYEKR